MEDSDFVKNDIYGGPKKCKFCRKEVWWHKYKRRWYEVGGEILHVENCRKTSKFYRNQALNRAEARRRKRFTSFKMEGNRPKRPVKLTVCFDYDYETPDDRSNVQCFWYYIEEDDQISDSCGGLIGSDALSEALREALEGCEIVEVAGDVNFDREALDLLNLGIPIHV